MSNRGVTLNNGTMKAVTPATTGKQQTNLSQILGRVLFWVVIVIIALYTLLPFVYAISISFRTNAQVLITARYLPEELNLTNYQNLLSDPNFMSTMRNSALVASLTVLISLVLGSFAAYALGRVQFRGKMAVLYIILAMTMFPQISILSGLFAIVRQLQVYGSPVALILTYPVFILPFTVWVLTSFFQGLPDEIEQAALVDGATGFQTFRMILLPLTAPALVTTGLLAFISGWNEYLFALTFTLVNPESWTVPVAIGNFAGYSFEVPVADRVAGAVVVTIPVLVLVLIFQRRIIEGLTSGAVKG